MSAAIAGGIGLFLLGMILLTDGLKAAAGDALRRVLTRFTGGRLKSLLSGVAVTALVQSSSATTLATIGFVSAGLLTFPQAVGVIFGANLGTTSTGWVVSLLGLKLNLGRIALPLVAAGALLRLLGRGRVAPVGLAVAGFGLIFVGIDTLQAGMSGLSTRIDPSALPGGTPAGRLLLVGIGIGMTVVLQSSSAAMAATLTALASGTIDLPQGAALVIGQNVGTTVTAGLAVIGASVPARRTALAHVLFNVLTGAVAFAVLPLLLRVADAVDGIGSGPATLAAFHSVFNLLGVAILLPGVHRFSRLVERIVPDRGPALTRHLDASVAALPPVAVEAARRALVEVLRVAASAVRDRLDGVRGAQVAASLAAAGGALEAVRSFMAQVRSAPEAHAAYARHVSTLHASDHLQRLIEAGGELAGEPAAGEVPVWRAAATLRQALDAVIGWSAPAPPPVDHVARISGTLADAREAHRHDLLERTARGELSPDAAARLLEHLRWIDRVGYHLWRAVHHLGNGTAEPGSVAEAVEDPAAGHDMARL